MGRILEEIQSLMDEKRGYHNAKEVRSKECAQCHSEHHGRKFDMMRFDQEEFDHDLTGYELTGAHDRIDCRECHIPDFIADLDIRKRGETFLGLEHDCIACHDDVHQNTLSTNDCASCHSTEEFAPAEFFNHDDTEYPLRGQHIEVDCIECHPIETRNGADFQVFTGIEFANCISCHEDVHNNVLGTDCKQCHNEQSFTSQRTIRRFNHNQTNFPLNGAHQQVNCAECHNMETGLTQLFQDQLGIEKSLIAKLAYSYHVFIGPGELGIGLEAGFLSKSFEDNFIAIDNPLNDPSIPKSIVLAEVPAFGLEGYFS